MKLPKNRITPENITSLGSNLSGRYGVVRVDVIEEWRQTTSFIDDRRIMKFTRAIYFLLLCSSSIFAQQPHISMYVNGRIDTANVEISQVIRVWDSYLNSNPDSTYDNPFWLTSEKKRYTKFDLLNSTYISPSLYYFLPHFGHLILPACA